MQVKNFRDIIGRLDQLNSQIIQQQLNKLSIECQTRCEKMIFAIIKFFLDYIIDGPTKIKASFDFDNKNIRKEIQYKLQLMASYFGKKEQQQIKQQLAELMDFGNGFSDSEKEEEELEESFQIKLTGHLKEFSPEITELKQLVTKQQEEIDTLKRKILTKQTTLEALTASHMKDMQNIKQQIFKQDSNGDDTEYLEVQYFDQTLMLEPEIIELINQKIRGIKLQYERFVAKMIESNRRDPTPRRKQSFSADNIQTLSVRDLIKIIFEKQQNMYQIWKIMQDIKGNQYILQVIVKQQFGYGIEYKEINDILKDTRGEIKDIIELRQQIQNSINIMTQQFLEEQQQQQKDIEHLKMQNFEQNASYEQNLNNIRNLYQNQNHNEVNLNSKISHLQQELLESDQQIQQLRNSIRFQNIRINNLTSNISVLLKQLLPKTQSIKLDIINLYYDKSDIVKELIFRLNNISQLQAITVKQMLEFMLYQDNTIKIISTQKIRTQNQSTQTKILGFEYRQECIESYSPELKQRDSIKATEQIQSLSSEQQKINLSDIQLQIKKQKSIGVQCFDEELSSKKAKIINDEQVNEYKERKQQLSIDKIRKNQEDKNNVYERLFNQSKKLSDRIRQIKPYIERLKDEEFKELYVILNLQLSRQQSNNYIPYSLNPVVELPQQDLDLNQSLSKYAESYRFKTSNYVKKINKTKENTEITESRIFGDLDGQRDHSLRQYEQHRIDTYRRRLKKLCPSPEIKELTFSDKLRPRTLSKNMNRKP
ncbi:hypothetical protein pb186bvf_004136 [Paramecium bursaria]